MTTIASYEPASVFVFATSGRCPTEGDPEILPPGIDVKENAKIELKRWPQYE
jgi:hypothetical protein